MYSIAGGRGEADGGVRYVRKFKMKKEVCLECDRKDREIHLHKYEVMRREEKRRGFDVGGDKR